MYNALCCSIFTPDLDVSGGVPGAKSGTAQAVPVVSPPTPLLSRIDQKEQKVGQNVADSGKESKRVDLVLRVYMHTRPCEYTRINKLHDRNSVSSGKIRVTQGHVRASWVEIAVLYFQPKTESYRNRIVSMRSLSNFLLEFENKSAVSFV